MDTIKRLNRLGMYGVLAGTNNPYSLYLLDGKKDWDYMYTTRSKWDSFFGKKDAPVSEANMRAFLNHQFEEVAEKLNSDEAV